LAEGFFIPKVTTAGQGFADSGGSLQEKEVEKHARSCVEGKKDGKRVKWGSVLPERKSTRIQNEGRTEKAQDNKKRVELEENYPKGKNRKSHKSTSTKLFMEVGKVVDIELGENEDEMSSILDTCAGFDISRRGAGLDVPIRTGEDVSRRGDTSVSVGKVVSESNLDEG
jgi:hypothetical protein